MKINTNSWHYKLNRYTWGNDIPEHFCPYARLLLFNILIGGWLEFLFRHVNITIELPHWGIMRFMRNNTWLFNIHMLYGLWGMYGVLRILTGETEQGIISVAITAGSYIALRTLGRGVKFFETKSKKFKTISEKSIILQSAKANHNKICPHLEFVDDKIIKFNEDVSAIEKEPLDEKQPIKKEPVEKTLKPDSKLE